MDNCDRALSFRGRDAGFRIKGTPVRQPGICTRLGAANNRYGAIELRNTVVAPLHAEADARPTEAAARPAEGVARFREAPTSKRCGGFSDKMQMTATMVLTALLQPALTILRKRPPILQ